MRQRPLGAVMILHGLAHSAAGVWGSSSGRAWLVVPLWWLATTGLVAAGLGLLGVPLLRRRWRRLAMAALLASVVLLTWIGRWMLLVGIVVDVFVLLAIARTGDHVTAQSGAPGSLLRRAARIVGNAAAAVLLAYLSVSLLSRPWYSQWGASRAERAMALPGDELVGNPRYRMDHVVLIPAPADSVWQWLVQIGQDRAGFYSYDRLERMFGADIRNADLIRPEWQRRDVGDLVRATQPDYLGGAFGQEIGWRITRIDRGRALVLRNWGAFVLHPLDSQTTRLHVRVRGPGSAGLGAVLLGPLNAFVLEPAHFIMERGMLLGIKQRAERMMQRS